MKTNQYQSWSQVLGDLIYSMLLSTPVTRIKAEIDDLELEWVMLDVGDSYSVVVEGTPVDLSIGFKCRPHHLGDIPEGLMAVMITPQGERYEQPFLGNYVWSDQSFEIYVNEVIKNTARLANGEIDMSPLFPVAPDNQFRTDALSPGTYDPSTYVRPEPYVPTGFNIKEFGSLIVTHVAAQHNVTDLILELWDLIDERFYTTANSGVSMYSKTTLRSKYTSTEPIRVVMHMYKLWSGGGPRRSIHVEKGHWDIRLEQTDGDTFHGKTKFGNMEFDYELKDLITVIEYIKFMLYRVTGITVEIDTCDTLFHLGAQKAITESELYRYLEQYNDQSDLHSVLNQTIRTVRC